MGNPVTYWDPSGNSARITLGSLQSALEQGVSAFEIRDAYYLQVGSNSLAVEYAKNHNPQYVDGKLKTWANEADAYRHFTWNYKMVKKMNYDKALKISSAHEIAFLREHKVIVYVTDSSSTLRNAFMTLENLMDIWNNSRAVDAAASGMYSSAEAAFQALLNNGDLITSPDQVAAKYGFDPSKMTKGINNINGFNVK